MPEVKTAQDWGGLHSDPFSNVDGVLASLLSSSTDCIKILDLDGRLLYLNEPSRLVLAIQDGDSILGSNSVALWDGDGRGHAETAIQQARQGETGRFEGCYAAVKQDGRWWEVVISPIRNKGGVPERLLSVARDVTAHRRAEKLVQEKRRLFRRLMDQVPVICFVTEADGKIEWFNQRWYEYTGLTEEQSLGVAWQNAHPPEWQESLRQFIKDVDQRGDAFERLTQIRGKRGRLGWFLIRGTPVHEDGEPLRWFGTAINVHEQFNDERERKRQIEDLEHANRELSDFAHILSHDLQTHIRSMLSFSQLLTRQFGDSIEPEARELAEGIEHGAQRMYELIRTVLAYSLTARKPVTFKQVDLNEALESVLAVLGPLLNEACGRVVAGPLPEVWGDRVLVQQLLQNLLGNSVKYRLPERTLEIRVNAERSGEDWTICVADNGMGVAAKNHERIFAPLLRLHDESIPGTGLGLAVCRRIVERHHGKIWVESELGSGCHFFFTLPCCPMSADSSL